MTRTVLITGTSTGIGRETALHLVSRGYRVFGTVREMSQEDQLEEVGVEPLLMDVTDPVSVKDAVAGMSGRLGGEGLWGLVNNAGITGAGPVELLTEDDFRRVFDVNFFGVVTVTRECLPLIRASRGRIVNVSSISGVISLPFMAPYSASKFALEALSDSLRRELHPFGVRVVSIQPGPIKTPIWSKAASLSVPGAKGTPYEPVLERFKDVALEGGARGLPASEVARAIDRALSDESPPPRIPVLRNRARLWMMRFIPGRLLDWLTVRAVWRGREPE